MSSGSSVPSSTIGVGHAHHRQVLVALAATVARLRAALLAGPEVVPHVVGEHAVLDEHVALGGVALVVDGDACPTRPVIVPSSTRVTSGEATCSPTLPAIDAAHPSATRSASSPWPHASWNSTPPLPCLITTGIAPLGAGRASQLGERLAGGLAGELLDVDGVEQLEADGVADRLGSRSACRCRRRPRTDAQQRADDLSSSASTPSVLATRTCFAAVAVAGRHLDDLRPERPGGLVHALRAARPWRPWRPSSGSCSTVLRPVGRRAGERDGAHSAAALAGRRSGRTCGRGQSRPRTRSAVWAKPVVSPATTRMPAPRSRPLETCSTLPSSRPADVERLSSAYTSAKSAPVRTAPASTRSSTSESIIPPSLRAPLTASRRCPATIGLA